MALTLFAEQVIARLAERGHAGRRVHLRYPGAGHLIGPPYEPTTILAGFHPIRKLVFAYGGSPEANAHARADSWPRVLAFLRDCLGRAARPRRASGAAPVAR